MALNPGAIETTGTGKTCTRYEDNITCPHCGYVFEDSWERRGDSADTICDNCGAGFFWEKDITIRYNTLLTSLPTTASQPKGGE